MGHPHLCRARVGVGDQPKAVLSSLVAAGVTQREIFQSYIPDVARMLGEMWVQDRASFVDVTLGASRLQVLFREHDEDGFERWMDRSIPLGQSVMMIIPEFEQHSLGAFVAADQLRRHGLWVHMGIGLTRGELTGLVSNGRFSMLGLSVATGKSLEKVTELIDHIRANNPGCPPIVVGGRVVEDAQMIERRTGADHAVKSICEAIERCGLAAVGQELPFDSSL